MPQSTATLLFGDRLAADGQQDGAVNQLDSRPTGPHAFAALVGVDRPPSADVQGGRQLPLRRPQFGGRVDQAVGEEVLEEARHGLLGALFVRPMTPEGPRLIQPSRSCRSRAGRLGSRTRPLRSDPGTAESNGRTRAVCHGSRPTGCQTAVEVVEPLGRHGTHTRAVGNQCVAHQADSADVMSAEQPLRGGAEAEHDPAVMAGHAPDESGQEATFWMAAKPRAAIGSSALLANPSGSTVTSSSGTLSNPTVPVGERRFGRAARPTTMTSRMRLVKSLSSACGAISERASRSGVLSSSRAMSTATLPFADHDGTLYR